MRRPSEVKLFLGGDILYPASRGLGRTTVGTEELKDALASVLAPMVESDEGELFLVSSSASQVHLHLRGRFAGCPGNGLVVTHLVAPWVRTFFENAKVEVTSGPILPAGATRVTAQGKGEPVVEKLGQG